jgi:hypothetical protein
MLGYEGIVTVIRWHSHGDQMACTHVENHGRCLGAHLSFAVRPSHSSSGRTHHGRRRHQGSDVGESCSRTFFAVSGFLLSSGGTEEIKLAIGFEHADYSTAESGAGCDHMTS